MNNSNILVNERLNPRQSPNLLYVKPTTNYELLNDIMNKNTTKRANNKLINFGGINKANNLQNNRYSPFTKQQESSNDNSLENYLSNLKNEVKQFNNSASPVKLNYESKLNNQNYSNEKTDNNYHFSKPVSPGLLGINNLSYNALKNIASNNILKNKNLHSMDQIGSIKKNIIAKINRNNSNNISRVLSPNINPENSLYSDQNVNEQNRPIISPFRDKDSIMNNPNLNTLENGSVNNLKYSKNYQNKLQEDYDRSNQELLENSKGKLFFN